MPANKRGCHLPAAWATYIKACAFFVLSNNRVPTFLSAFFSFLRLRVSGEMYISQGAEKKVSPPTTLLSKSRYDLESDRIMVCHPLLHLSIFISICFHLALALGWLAAAATTMPP